jgi:hypothetical protein
MTDDDAKPEGPAGEAEHEQEDEALIGLIKKATRSDGEAHPPDLLRGVQHRIRQRSKGKFFRDGWSTSQTRMHYALVAALMLLLVALVYFAMTPGGFG